MAFAQKVPVGRYYLGHSLVMRVVVGYQYGFVLYGSGIVSCFGRVKKIVSVYSYGLNV